MKLSRRKRYVLKWNGPNCLSKQSRKQNKANLGKGDILSREIAYYYECRYKGYFPEVSYDQRLMPKA
jgi:hypothetical protein